MTDLIIGTFLTSAVSLLILIAAYLYLWQRGRQPSMGLWAMGWAVYTLRFLALAGESMMADPLPWQFVNLSTLGLSGFLLWAGTRSFIGRPIALRTYGWGLIPILWALGVFLHLPSDSRLIVAPISAFSAAVDIFTMYALLRYARHVRNPGIAWVLGGAYALWAMLKLIHPLTMAQSPLFIVGLLLMNTLALGLAFSLIGLSLIEAERSARRRTERLNALARLTSVPDRFLSPSELLTAALDEVGRLLGVDEGLGAFLIEEESRKARLITAKGLSPRCHFWQGEGSPFQECLCRRATAECRLVWLEGEKVISRLPDCDVNLAIPILGRDRALGFLVATLPPDSMLSRGEQQTLEALGRQLGTLLENARLFEGLRREVKRLEALTRASRHMALGMDLEAVLREIVSAAREVLDVDRAVLYLHKSRTGQVGAVYAEGLSPEYLNSSLADLHSLLSPEGEEMVWVEDAQQAWEMPSFQAASRREGYRSVLVLPIRRREQALGALVFYHDRVRPYLAEDRQFCQALADQTAMAVENALLYQEAQRRLEELTALHEIDLQVSSALELEAVLETVAEQLVRIMGISTLYIGLYDPLRDEIHLPVVLDQGQRLPPLRVGVSAGGLAGWVIRSGEPLWVDDMEKERNRLEVQAVQLGEPTRSLAVLPLVVKGRVVGVLSAQSYEPYAFDSGDRQLLTELATQTAIAIENARLYQETVRRLAEARILQEISLAAASTLDFDQVLERAIDAIGRLLGVEYLNFMFPNEKEGCMVTHRALLGFSPSPEGTYRFPINACITGRVYRTGQPALVPDVTLDPDYAAAAEDVRSELAVPVKIGEEVVAVLNLESRRPAAFDEDDLAFYTAVAGQLGVALENARLYQQEQRRRQEAETLYRAAQALTTTLDLQEVLDRILTELQEVVPYDSASVQLLQGDKLEIIGGRGFPNLEELLGLSFHLEREDNPNSQVMRTRAPLILDDASAIHNGFRQEPHAAAGIRAWMGVPLLFGDRPIGMLALDKREPGFYTPEYARVAMAFATQAAIAIENARLYQQLEEKSAELSQALRELQELDQLRNQVVQNVSHELRTPLTLIQGYTQLLLSGDLGPIIDTQRSALEVIYDRSVTLSRLIYNLTALQAIPQGTFTTVPLQLPELISFVFMEYRLAAEAAGVRLEATFPKDMPPALGDREYLKLAFTHLIENAIKFSPNGGAVEVHGWAEDRWVYVTVRDQGIGIAPEHMDRIFERFYQADGSTTRRFGGMGVGLALVWEIVEAHGGKVWVESEVGKGSTFTVKLPRA